MKTLLRMFFGTFVFTLFSLAVPAQEFKWETKSDEARGLAKQGMKHLVNVELEMAYDKFQEALELDPDFTAAQVCIGVLSFGAKKAEWAAKAKQSSANKSAGEKLFASLLEAKDDRGRHEIWKKLVAMYPKEPFVEFSLHSSDPDSVRSRNSLLAFTKKYPDRPEAYNILGYLYLNMKDQATARTYFEKYIQLYPDGYNPYDSMGEFYFLTGDMENSRKFYTMALERYPFCVSSLRKMEELKKAEDVASTNPK